MTKELVDGYTCGGKPVPAIHLCNDTKFTIDKVYNKTYNGKSRHIREA